MRLSFFLAITLLTFASLCFAVDIPTVPDDVTAGVLSTMIIDLVKNWKGMGALAIAANILVLLISFLKSPLMGDWFGSKSSLIKRVTILILGQILGILLMILGGTAWWTAVINGLFVSGGAIAIYEAIKPFLKK